MSETWHVTPINDVEEHEESVRCHCKPKVEYHENGKVVIHNAFDGRELYELDNTMKN